MLINDLLPLDILVGSWAFNIAFFFSANYFTVIIFRVELLMFICSFFELKVFWGQIVFQGFWGNKMINLWWLLSYFSQMANKVSNNSAIQLRFFVICFSNYCQADFLLLAFQKHVFLQHWSFKFDKIDWMRDMNIIFYSVK